jgi:hypothetical protein
MAAALAVSGIDALEGQATMRLFLLPATLRVRAAALFASADTLDGDSEVREPCSLPGAGEVA